MFFFSRLFNITLHYLGRTKLITLQKSRSESFQTMNHPLITPKRQKERVIKE